MRVLVVDDSGTMRTIQKRCLNKLGINDVVEAEDGVQALKVLSLGAFDLILTDWNMPNMDGLSLLKNIRAQDKQTPVFMITTEGERGRVIEAIQCGVSDYLVKPFTPDGLKTKLEKWVSLPTTA